MKKLSSTLSILFVSSMLLWGIAPASADIVTSEAGNSSAYCHMKFPPMLEDTLSWEQPVLDTSAGSVIDFYGSCDHNPVGEDEIRTQRRFRGDDLE
ncbi:MAG: hypothetical protein OEN50_14770 [Deltaproteobacteria bacterium]|nr:hypothetical protein [Deltaproteobacteria bacterium]